MTEIVAHSLSQRDNDSALKTAYSEVYKTAFFRSSFLRHTSLLVCNTHVQFVTKPHGGGRTLGRMWFSNDFNVIFWGNYFAALKFVIHAFPVGTLMKWSFTVSWVCFLTTSLHNDVEQEANKPYALLLLETQDLPETISSQNFASYCWALVRSATSWKFSWSRR